MEVTKGLNLADRVPEELRTEVHKIVHEVVVKIIPKKKCKKGSQEIPGATGKCCLEVQNEAERLTVLSTEHTGHSKHPLPTTKETPLHMDISRWSIPKSD